MPDMNEKPRETTDLIDVRDVAEHYDEVTPVHKRDPLHDEPLGVPDEPLTQVGGLELALLKSRFAAFLLDALILYIVYWLMMIIYRGIALEQAAGPVPIVGIHGLIFHGLAVLIFFLYFFLCEVVLYGTPGKLLCRLRVRSSNGGRPSIGSILMRNILRPVDLVLFPLLISAALMEWTRHHQRLGDLIGRTIVIVTRSATTAHAPVTISMLPGAIARIIAFSIDLTLFLIFAIGYLMILSPKEPLMSMMLVVYAPVFGIFFFMLPEAFMSTSVGKWIFGYYVLGEDGTPIGVPRAFVRTLFLPIDITPFGFAATLFSPRHQRIGDNAAGTVVARRPRKIQHLIGVAAVVAAVALFVYAGMSNRDNFMSDSFEVNFLPALDVSDAGAVTPSGRPRGIISITSFQFAGDSPDKIRRPAIFKPGETVYLVFAVMGGSEKDDMVWLQEDLTVRYPDGSTGLSLDNIIDFHQKVDQPGPVEMTNNIALPEDAQPGRYTVSIVVRDNNNGRQINEQRFFYVSPPRKTRRPPVEQPAN